VKVAYYSGLLIVLCLGTSGCNDEPGDAAATVLGQGEWTMQSMTRNGNPTPPLAGTRVSISFKGDRFFGSSGCNSYEGTYRAKKGGQFSIGELGGTEMACDEPAGVMQQEISYLDALSRVRAFSVKQNQLILSDGTAQNRVVFVPYQAPAPLPLAGTTWNLDTFEESADISVSAIPVLDQAPITLLIEVGKAGGSGGCNRYDAVVKAGKGTLIFGALAITKNGCAPEIQQQEQRFFAALTKMTRYEILGEDLRMHNADGTLTLYFSGKP
jgi:heat shock protein HslJ